ncbi:sigma-54 dependent transcriptional regulator [Undibacterium sp. RTI2.1]|uniref:sigma-54-dependent transcriptional regulator n=1 Tax=unclassified Undibacterium TaxID=2630295 RepID=UPI002B226AFC|nr:MULTISPECIES: sigma-54 dependent transcriptional regulator [unclassified Undibacterium]MEB0029537.1 sigma-54 dependent transcriptional regulator [Undibacterium sp. RTI2.1]MEB0115724.1 sigma-54 dependent transcriptional regulator [Undibacterium sp. RTI2.2]
MSNSAPHLLIIDDDPDVACAAQLLLRRKYAQVKVVTEPAQVKTLLAREHPDVVLLDFNFTAGRTDGGEGLAMLDLLRAQHPAPAVIAITAYADVPLAVEALKRGACDFITKPWDNARLLAAVETALARKSTTHVSNKSGTSDAVSNNDTSIAFANLMGNSASMRELKSMIANVAPTEANVMVLGENGVGKELVARAIHLASPRKAAHFLAVDMGAIPETTFESDMFGHRKGAFTDARSDRAGRFQTARGGVLFLDEIGNLPLGAQAKLLTALERREVTPVGMDKAEKIDVRIVSATNLSEVKLFDPSIFRSDLLFRLNTIVLRVAPLRERREDIPDLLSHYLALYQNLYQRPVRQLSDTALNALCEYDWPGNVRSLRHSCERAVILGTQADYQLQDFGLRFANTTLVAMAEVAGIAPDNNTQNTVHTFKLTKLERDTIASAMTQASGNISQAAKLLGLSRAALYRKLEKHDI